MNKNDLFINVIGAVIKQAIKDYHNKFLKEKNYNIWNDAKDFLFFRGRLESFLVQFGLQNQLNCEYVRKLALVEEVKDEGD